MRLFLVLLVAHLLTLLSTAAAAATTTDEDGKSSGELKLEHVASTMTSITVKWSVNSSEASATTAAPPVYHVKALSVATGVLLVSPQLSVNETQYTLPDLAVDAKYNVCVTSTGIAQPACAELSTIPPVRVDSLIAFFAALAVLAVVIIIAVVLWRCAVRRADSSHDSADTPSEGKPDVDDNGANEKSPLLVPSTAEPVQAGPPPADPANTPQSDAGNQPEQPQSLYLFLAGHAFK